MLIVCLLVGGFALIDGWFGLDAGLILLDFVRLFYWFGLFFGFCCD